MCICYCRIRSFVIAITVCLLVSVFFWVFCLHPCVFGDALLAVEAGSRFWRTQEQPEPYGRGVGWGGCGLEEET